MSRARIAVSLLLAACLPIAARAAAEMGAIEDVKGSVVAVDAKAKTLTVQVQAEGDTPAGEVRLVADDQTKVIRDGQAIALSDLKKGDSVVVNYRTDAGKKVAVSIGVQGSGRG